MPRRTRDVREAGANDMTFTLAGRHDGAAGFESTRDSGVSIGDART